MTMAFIIIYVVIALILVALINLVVVKNSKRKSKRQLEQTKHSKHASNESYQSKFKVNDDHDSKESNVASSYKQDVEDDQDKVEANPAQSIASTEDNRQTTTDSDHEQINPNSEEAQVNEQLKQKHSSFMFGKGTSQGKVLIAMIFGMFIAILNQTLLNVALPKINTDFNISANTGQWLMTGFMLVNGILIPISAFLFNKYSYRKLFLVSMTLFTIGSLVCGLSGSFTMMMVGRVLQAIGAGVLMPLGTNVFMTIFPPERRGAAMGMLGIAMILAPAIGPTLSGYIVENYHWNVMFYGMFIIGLVSLAIAYIWFRVYQVTTNPKADIPGIIFSTIGFGALLYGFSEAGNDSWSSPVVVISLIAGVVFIAAFVIREVTMRVPMLDMAVLKYSGFTLTTVINMIVTMSLFGGMILLPLYLQNLRGFTPVQSGLLLLPGALIMGVMGPIAGRLLDSIGIKPLALVGTAIMTYATWELTKLNMNTTYGHLMLIYIVRSFGMSFIMMPIMTAGMNSLPQRLIAHGNALTNTLRQLAGSIGTALLVTVMSTQTTQHIASYSQALDKTNPFIKDRLQEMSQALGGEQMATQSVLEFVQKLASINGVNSAFLIATGLSALAFVLSLFLKGKSHYMSNEE
ncbi:DHA2 family efflux MFS transporter permease subunit [Staphylococcus gallinarum]|jgi:EmrB/QacA subfamily drug resistance transporter|uniref:Quinolone resistance protein NorB n=1 Tax=Staphylococcus gallinarum TaxID=1293 RepID=A0A2T4T175_STAGA|nr:DHA2 family efflux MFS transporter permease subunit [Staphylococcus gallinarum]MCD8821465.1 DHA2 family efflux MFS transporter permease subunit [Staphylococcus gallinarum]MCD8826983.1 DHA2 family efflux MFS transporter permease subunit [Staphylococcus gallinarum]MCQ9289813.1 DHA2 family efflux MFS transporter permease subunit [Staphylococcus gallinarum]MEB6243192.1 DHA2 family efflux MFS transporter permease subunit [Staphylococcus gallinarum]MEB6296265.1 DHA2 family efflux MFS transporter 